MGQFTKWSALFYHDPWFYQEVGDILKSPYYAQKNWLRVRKSGQGHTNNNSRSGISVPACRYQSPLSWLLCSSAYELVMGHGERQSLKLIWDEVFWEASSVGLRGWVWEGHLIQPEGPEKSFTRIALRAQFWMKSKNLYGTGILRSVVYLGIAWNGIIII